MLQDPLALLGESSEEEDDDAPGAKKPRLDDDAAGVSFAELQSNGYRPMELLESAQYLQDMAGQEERKPCEKTEAVVEKVEEKVEEEEEEVEEPQDEKEPEPPKVQLRQSAKSSAAVPSPCESFEEARAVLHQKLHGPLSELGFEKPTPIQSYCIPIAASGRDVIGVSPTGSGKTLAFLLPSFSRLLRFPGASDRWPLMLVLGPTRELVVQIQRSAERLLRACGLQLESIYGGAPKQQQLAGLRRRPGILAATPGRLLEILEEEPALSLRFLRVLVLDEADRMLGEGFEGQVRRILAEAPQRQTLLFSATWPRSVETFALEVLRDPVEVRVGALGASGASANPNVVQDVMILRDDFEKPAALTKLLRGRLRKGRAIVFVATKRSCQQLERSLRGRLPVDAIHGDRSQRDREAALSRFRAGDVKVLLATDVAGRGLDVKEVSLVVNYDMPRSVEDYVHRIGRTGRQGKGLAVSILTDNDQDAMSLIAKVIRDSGARLPPELAKRVLPSPSTGVAVDPRMHWLEPWKGLDGNTYNEKDLKSAVEELWS